MAPKKAPAKSARPRARRATGGSANPASEPKGRHLSPTLAASEAPTQSSSFSLGWLAVGVLILGVLATWAWRRGSQSADTSAPTVPAPSATVAAPPSVVTPSLQAVPVKISAEAQQPRLAMKGRSRVEGHRSGRVFSLGSGKSLNLRCWRVKGSSASLAIFGEHNNRVRSLVSGAGNEGWLELGWDGRDDQGKPVAPGLYYALPSQPGDEIVLVVKVKN